MEDIDNLIASLAQDAQAVRTAPHPFLLGIGWIGFAAVYLFVCLAVTGVRPDWAARLHDPRFAAEIAALCAMLFSTTFAAALLAFPDMHQKGRLLLAPPIALMLFAITLIISSLHDVSPLPVHSFECTLAITAMALLPSMLMFLLLRRYASTHCSLSGGNALLSSFCIGALWLRLHEVNDSVVHVIEWHYLPMFAIGMLGLWLGKKLLQW